MSFSCSQLFWLVKASRACLWSIMWPVGHHVAHKFELWTQPVFSIDYKFSIAKRCYSSEKWLWGLYGMQTMTDSPSLEDSEDLSITLWLAFHCNSAVVGLKIGSILGSWINGPCRPLLTDLYCQTLSLQFSSFYTSILNSLSIWVTS